MEALEGQGLTESPFAFSLEKHCRMYTFEQSLFHQKKIHSSWPWVNIDMFLSLCRTYMNLGKTSI